MGPWRTPPVDSLAVLPFVNTAGDPGLEYLSDGISDSLITSLSRLPAVRVKSRDSVFPYKGTQTDASRIARELGVRAVVTGRVVQRGDRITIAVELIDARDGTLIWSDQFNRSVADVLAAEQEISRRISDNLRLELTGEERKMLTQSSPANAEAYLLYLKGRYQDSLAGFEQATELFSRLGDPIHVALASLDRSITVFDVPSGMRAMCWPKLMHITPPPRRLVGKPAQAQSLIATARSCQVAPPHSGGVARNAKSGG